MPIRRPSNPSLFFSISKDIAKAKDERPRRLAYAFYGKTTEPILANLVYFHGWSNSKLEAKILSNEARKRGIRVITIDRPGVGSSDVHYEGYLGREFGLRSFASDIHKLLTITLGLNTTTHPPHLMSYCAGASWLLAYRHLYCPNDFARAALVSPSPPTPSILPPLLRLPTIASLPTYLSTLIFPVLPLCFLNHLAYKTSKGKFTAADFANHLSNPVERACVERHKDKIEYIIWGLHDAIVPNYGIGWWRDGLVNMRRREYRDGWVEKVLKEDKGVSVWVGERNDRIPVEFSRRMYVETAGMEQERFKVLQEEGHTSMLVERHAEVLDWLVS